MNEQQRAEYMAIVAAVMASEKLWYSSSWIASRAMEVWVSANKAANEAKP